VSALEQVALVAEAKIRRAFWFSAVGLAFPVIGLAVAAFLIFTR
jgi:hypothetical protein